MWQHVKLSEQIRPRDKLACCWDAKQPTNFFFCGRSAVFSPHVARNWVVRRRSSTVANSLLVVESSCGHNWCLCSRQMEQSWRMWWTVCSAPSTTKQHLALCGSPRWSSGYGVHLQSGKSGHGTWLFPFESHPRLERWSSRGSPTWRLALLGQRLDWFAWCQYTVTG